MNSISGLLVCSLFVYVNCNLIALQCGQIEGGIEKTRTGRWFHAFYGIPYAKPPVKELRFKNPVPEEAWLARVRGADKPLVACLQYRKVLGNACGELIVGQEDCLYLNIFVPNGLLLRKTPLAPVMVCIHGGGYEVGSSASCDGNYFMDLGVIFVSINYRLGVLGFLGMNSDEISGNFGLKDQSMALRWIRKNIENFGGDPHNITLIGESSGAISVHLHMFSPLSKNQFHRAIMQSGNAFNGWSHSDGELGEALSKAVVIRSGCLDKSTDHVTLLKCLQRVPAVELLALESRFRGSFGLGALKSIAFSPMIESKVKDQPFLTEIPSKTNYQTVVPWITGINSGEGAAGVITNQPRGVNKKTILSGIGELSYMTKPGTESMELVQNIFDHYFGIDQDCEKMGFENMTLKFVDMVTDAQFLVGLVKTVQSASAGHRQYVYLYDHRGSFSFQKFSNYEFDLGVCHADETPLLFRHKMWDHTKWTSQDANVSKTLIKFWTNFAIFGDPNGQSGEKIWKPVETDDIEYLHIKSDSVVMEKKSFKERFDFWNALPLANKNV